MSPKTVPIPPDIRQEVLDLRRTHSQREVAELTGLPLGTVKTIISRSGAFRDNQAHRALFSLPPLRESAQTLPAAVEHLPPQESITGDREVDAVLWLRKIIATGDEALIEKARIAFRRIKTPLRELEERYVQLMRKGHPENPFAGLLFTGFDEVEELARAAIEKAALRREARARFGDSLVEATPAEQFCQDALNGLEPGPIGFLPDREVAARFKLRADLIPRTLGDCLHELAFWDGLYRLRSAVHPRWDSSPHAQARESWTFQQMAYIRPRSTEEAVAVLRYLADSNAMGRADAILMNLIGNR